MKLPADRSVNALPNLLAVLRTDLARADDLVRRLNLVVRSVAEVIAALDEASAEDDYPTTVALYFD